VLKKVSGADYATAWQDESGGGGGGSAGTFAQHRWIFNDFAHAANATGVVPFGVSAVSSGTLALPTGAAAPLFGAVALRSSTTAGGGYQLATAAGLFVGAGFAMRYVFRTPGIATATARIGISNSIATALANNFAFLEIVGLVATCRARRLISGNPEVVDPAPVTLTSNTNYVLDIDWISATEIRFVIWVLGTGEVVRNWTATTAEWPNPSTSSVVPSIRATESTTAAATDILIVDYAGFGPERPGSLPVPV
jgi:hypothetical protein